MKLIFEHDKCDTIFFTKLTFFQFFQQCHYIKYGQTNKLIICEKINIDYLTTLYLVI